MKEETEMTWIERLKYFTDDFDEAEFNKVFDYVKWVKVRDKPKVICYCGSLRVAFRAFQDAEYQSLIDGHIALLPCCMAVDVNGRYGCEPKYKAKADELHKRKIDIMR